MRAFALVICAACAPQATIPATVSLALPLPTITTAEIVTIKAPKLSVDEGDFTSERGLVHLSRFKGLLTGTFPSAVIVCKDGDVLACDWYESSQAGHATLHRRPGGRLEGTWGTNESAVDGGAWTLVPIRRSDNFDGMWDTNWGPATLKDSGHGFHADYASGSTDCELHGVDLSCQWIEGSSLTGGADLVVESPRVIRGRWGSGASTTDGGPWVFVRH